MHELWATHTHREIYNCVQHFFISFPASHWAGAGCCLERDVLEIIFNVAHRYISVYPEYKFLLDSAVVKTDVLKNKTKQQKKDIWWLLSTVCLQQVSTMDSPRWLIVLTLKGRKCLQVSFLSPFCYFFNCDAALPVTSW